MIIISAKCIYTDSFYTFWYSYRSKIRCAKKSLIRNITVVRKACLILLEHVNGLNMRIILEDSRAVIKARYFIYVPWKHICF